MFGVNQIIANNIFLRKVFFIKTKDSLSKLITIFTIAWSISVSHVHLRGLSFNAYPYIGLYKWNKWVFWGVNEILTQIHRFLFLFSVILHSYRYLIGSPNEIPLFGPPILGKISPELTKSTSIWSLLLWYLPDNRAQWNYQNDRKCADANIHFTFFRCSETKYTGATDTTTLWSRHWTTVSEISSDLILKNQIGRASCRERV